MKKVDKDVKTKPLHPPPPQGKLICSVCGKEFKVTGDTKYIINGGYTCKWKCFYKEAKRKDAERAKNGKNNKKAKK